MKKFFLYSAILLMLSPSVISCKKSNDTPETPVVTYSPGQGKITGTGGSTFNVTGSSSIFAKKVDTVLVQANIDPSANVGKQFIIACVAKAPGTYNFVNAAANSSLNITSGGVAVYAYETVNAAGTVIAHEFASSAGTYTITAVSATAITGTYSVTLNDFNNNNDAPLSISGTFSGNF